MTLAHLHLIMNHVPTIGSVVALALLILGYARRNDHLKHVGLELLFVIAVLALPVYVSGVAAHRELREIKEVSDDAIRIHQDVALFGFAWMEFAGFIAWVASSPLHREFGKLIDQTGSFDHGLAIIGWVPLAGLFAVLLLWRQPADSASLEMTATLAEEA